MCRKMTGKKKKLVLVAVFLSLLALLNFSFQAVFIPLLFGLLFLPPLLLFAWVLIAGAPIIAKELRALFESGKETFVISISRESIVLEPNLNR